MKIVNDTGNVMTEPNGHVPVDWEAVYWQQTPRLYNYFRYRTGDGDTAQELTAKTMERAWRYRERYRHDLGALEAWLFQIARNILADWLMQRRPPDLPLDAIEHLAEIGSVEHEIEQRQNAARLYTLLAKLKPADQELIALKYGAGLTNRAIAAITTHSESSVGTTLHRVIQKLRLEWGVTEDWL
jgi:RNA polymerase sigma-70 factor (ECF subfamily)